MLDIYQTQNVFQASDTPLWMMFYGVSGTCFGFWALGHRGIETMKATMVLLLKLSLSVMKTIGKKITEINPCK